MADFSLDDGGNGGSVAGESGSGSSGGPGQGGIGATSGGGGNETGSVANSATDGPIPIKRRRGRPALTPEERAARAEARANSTALDAGGKEGLAVKFKKNDRSKVVNNIAGIHMMAAVLTKQPIMALNPTEAQNLTNALCDVADYHEIDLLGAGGAFGLYAALATTAYAIYFPRIIAIKSGRVIEGVTGPAPTTPGEAKQRANSGAVKMDFGADIASSIN